MLHMSKALAVASEEHRGGPQKPALNLSAEARAVLDAAGLTPQQREIAELFLFQRAWQQAFWQSDVDDLDTAVNQAAAATEITAEMARAAIGDVLKPEQFEKHLFLNNLAASAGDIALCLQAYQGKDRHESDHPPLAFTEEDVKPYIRQLDITFNALLKRIEERNKDAGNILIRLLQDLADVSGIQFKGWLRRLIVKKAPDDLTGMAWDQFLRDHPDQLDALIRRIIDGAPLALPSGAPQLSPHAG